MSRAEIFSGSDRAQVASQSAPGEVVEGFQRDLVRVAFALTGSTEESAALARRAFIDVLTGPSDDEVDPNTWSRLLLALGRDYLAGADLAALPDDEPVENASHDERERKRLREALLLLTRPMRAALVLRDLGGLNIHDAALLTDFEADEFEPMLDWSRERVREAAGGLTDESPQRLLSTLAVEAPRPDLWPAVRPLVEAHAARRRKRNRRIVATALALTLAGSLAVAVWFAGGISAFMRDDEPATPADDAALIPDTLPTRPPRPTATPAPTPTAVELIDAVLPGELQLVGNLISDEGHGTGERIMFNVDPESAEPLTELPALVNPYFSSDNRWTYTSPDGRWTVLQHSRRQAPPDAEEPEDAPALPVLSVVRDGVALDWEFVVPNTSYYDSWDSAILGDRLYVAFAPQRAPSIVVLDLETGDVIDTLSLDLPFTLPRPEPGEWSPNVFVQLYPFAGADAAQLYALVTTDRQDAAIRKHVSRSIFRIHLAEPRAERLVYRDFESGAAGEPVPQDLLPYTFSGASILPDGSGLYQTWWSGVTPQAGIAFLDFASGEVEVLTTEFILPRAVSEQASIGFVMSVSNDGRRLFIISNDSGEVAVVDLARRRIERTFPLDLGDVARWPLNVRAAHLSHDGRSMYLIGEAWWFNQQPPEQTPLWVVDLSTWRLVQRIDVPGYIQSLYADPGGATLYVLAQIANQGDRQDLRYRLISYVTGTYETSDVLELSGLVERNASFQLVASSENYRQTYGRTPTVDGIEPGDVEEYTTLPRARVVAAQELVPLEVTAPVELEFLDPATGRPLDGPATGVRFDPEQPRLLVFEKPGAKSLITVTAEIAPGQLAGTVRLKELGFWDARVIVGDGDRDGYTLVLPDVVRATPTFEGTDGRPYVMVLESDPAGQIPAGDVLIRAGFVDAATYKPLPGSVDLADGLPEEIRIALTGPASADYEIGDLVTGNHGVYETTLTVSKPGPWDVRLIFRQPDSDESRAIQVEIGTLEIVPAPASAATASP